MYVVLGIYYYEDQEIRGLFKTEEAAFRHAHQLHEKDTYHDEIQVRFMPTSRPITAGDQKIVWSNRLDLNENGFRP